MFVKLRMFAASLVICGKVVRAQLDVLSFEQPVVPRHVAKLGPDGYLLAVAKCDRFSVDVGVNKGKVIVPWYVLSLWITAHMLHHDSFRMYFCY